MSGFKIMICDDSPFVRKKMTDYVRACGIDNIIEAENGRQCVEKFRAEKPDLVFMDIVMPDMGGIEALSEIMKHCGEAKIIMASSIGTQKNLKDAILAGAYDFLQKPIEAEDVKRILTRVLGVNQTDRLNKEAEQ